MESNLLLGRKADHDLVMNCWKSSTFPLKAHKPVYFQKQDLQKGCCGLETHLAE